MDISTDVVYIVKSHGRTVLKTYDQRRFERWAAGPNVRKFVVPAVR